MLTGRCSGYVSWGLSTSQRRELRRSAWGSRLIQDGINRYSNGLSERVIGKAIKKYEIPREKLVILSKCYFGFEDAEVWLTNSFASP